MKEISPLHIFENALRQWWVVAILMILGGGIGWFVHNIQPPLYQATAELAINLNYSTVGMLTQYEEDHAIGMAGSLVDSTDVLNRVLEKAMAQNIAIDFPTLRAAAHFERQSYLWEIRIRYSDPQAAADLANLWVQEAYSALIDAQSHALQAQSYQRYLTGLETCLQQSVANVPSPGVCAIQSLPALQKEMQTTGAAYEKETLAARGISPALQFSISQTADISLRPAAFGTNSMILAGMVIGLIVSLWVISTNLLARILGRSQRA